MAPADFLPFVVVTTEPIGLDDEIVEVRRYTDRDIFNQASDLYKYDPRLIDIGYSDMVILLTL